MGRLLHLVQQGPEEGPGWAVVPPSPLLAVPSITTHPSTGSVPTSCYSMWHCNCLYLFVEVEAKLPADERVVLMEELYICAGALSTIK